MIPFQIHGRMHIPVHGNIYTGMSQQFTERLYIKSQLHTSGGECMSQTVKIHILNGTFPGDPFKLVLHRPGFNIFCLAVCEKIPLSFGGKPFHYLFQIIRQRDYADGTAAFRSGNDYLCLPIPLIGLKPLHRLMNIDGFLRKRNILPLKGAYLSHPDPCIQRKQNSHIFHG